MAKLHIFIEPNQEKNLKESGLKYQKKRAIHDRREIEALIVEVEAIPNMDNDDLCEHYGIDFDYVNGIQKVSAEREGEYVW